MSKQSQRMMDIDIARAIAAMLVVLEHIIENFPRYGMQIFHGDYRNVFVLYLLKYIHISIFITISGILIGASRQRVSGIEQYLQFERKKFLRLMLPYFSISMLQLLIKTVVPGRGLAEVPTALIGTFVAPHAGGMPHGWFLVSLMTIFLLWPLIGPLLDGKAFVPLLCGLIVLAILPISWPEYQGHWPYFELARTVWYLPIFLVGYWYGRHVFGRKQPGFRAVLLAGTVFLIAFSTHRFIHWPDSFGWLTLSAAVKWIGYFSTGFCVLWLCGLWCRKSGKAQTYMAWIGRFSYDIYLLHVIAGHILVLAVSRLHLGGAMIYVLPGIIAIFLVFIAMGIGQVVRRSPYLTFIVLGESLEKSYGTHYPLNLKELRGK